MIMKNKDKFKNQIENYTYDANAHMGERNVLGDMSGSVYITNDPPITKDRVCVDDFLESGCIELEGEFMIIKKQLDKKFPEGGRIDIMFEYALDLIEIEKSKYKWKHIDCRDY